MKLSLLALAAVMAGLVGTLPAQLAMAEDPECCMTCCDVNGDIQCQKTSTACFAGNKFTAGGKCGPGNNNWLCAKNGGGGGGGGSGSGTATCNGVTCESGCCVNGECKSRDTCEAVVADTVSALESIQKYGTYIAIGGAACLALCVAGCAFFLCRKKPKKQKFNNISGDASIPA